MKQINMLESPVRQVFFSYLVPSISATLVTSIYILADHDDDRTRSRWFRYCGDEYFTAALQHIFRDRNDVRSRRQRPLWVFQRTPAMKNAPEVILRRHSVWCLLCQQSF